MTSPIPRSFSSLLRVIWVLGPLLSSCSKAETTQHQIEVGGLTRTYSLFIPETIKTGTATPVVFLFHGSGGNGRGMDRMTGFSEVARREGFILVLPDAFEENWNDGRGIPGIAAMEQQVDDVAFVDAMIDEIANTRSIDPKRLFATGFSNGGIFVHLLAAKARHRLAAIAPVSGGIAEPVASGFKPAFPVSVLILHGTDDPMVPFKGGEVDYHGNGRIIATEDAARRWITFNELASVKPTSGALADTDKDDGCTVSWTRWHGAKPRPEVVLFTIHGGGHTWASGPQFLPIPLIGRVCRDIDATEVIWDFFKAHPRPAAK